MKKTIEFSYNGLDAMVHKFKVSRLLPNPYHVAVGPFVFLDHLLPYQQEAGVPEKPAGDFAHPHRGIATFSYIFNGELEHYDSRGHHGIVSAGGAQWMNAGNGIIHDEQLSAAFQQRGGELHSLQFWINLPGKNKAQDPDYMAVQADQVPEVTLDNGSMLRVLIGEYKGRVSKVPTFMEQFLYHVRLQPGSSFLFAAPDGFETAAFVADGKVVVNEQEAADNEIVIFSKEGDDVWLENKSNDVVDVMLFGGETYTEPIIAEGPFVMNSRSEITAAYNDFIRHKYGTISYNN